MAYRIIEGRYGFMVQLEVTKTKGNLWWKKEYKEWVLVNKYGDEPEYPHEGIRPPFKTIKKAKKFINKMQNIKELYTPTNEYTIPHVSREQRARTPPEPPLCRTIREGVGVYCDNCHSTMSKDRFLGLLGKRYCDNKKCKESKNGIH